VAHDEETHNLESHSQSAASVALLADAVPLDFGALVRMLGYRPPDAPSETPTRPSLPAALSRLVQDVFARGRALLDPAWHWQPIPISSDGPGDGIRCTGEASVTLAVGPLIHAQLRGSVALAAFVVTIGPRLEREARRLLAGGRPLEGYLLDAVGSLATEAVADRLQAEVAAEFATRGWKTTNRFSPGYCTWETAGQQALFSLLPPTPAGVSLSPSSLMTPLKSVSGLIGLGPAVQYEPYRCDLCALTTCQQRLTEARFSARPVVGAPSRQGDSP
jgi:hypothetical protein